MNVTKILVPIDYSGESDRALEWGASLAEKYGARLLLLHVVPQASEDLPESMALRGARLVGGTRAYWKSRLKCVPGRGSFSGVPCRSNSLCGTR